jgi:fucose 4-O-acetylase-like acetyltransferase
VQRDPWLDNSKMVLVTFVVIGHAWGLLESTQGTHWAYDFLYLWHIPAFVFISGYLSKSFEWDRRRMKNLLYTLLIPYLLFEPALYYYRVTVVHETEPGTLWLEPHWTMWYLIVLLMWRLVTPILKLHWLFLPLSVAVSVLGGFWNTDLLMLPRFLGLLPFFVLGLHLKPRHLAHLDDVWVRVAAVPALIGMAVAALFTDTWAQTAFLWYDAGYSDVGIDPVIAFQTRITVMTLGLVGAFSVLALVPRRSLGWFTAMGGATMVVYLFHGFVLKTVKVAGWPSFAQEHTTTGFVVTTLGAVALALLLASPPVRRVLEPFTNPFGWAESWRDRRAGRSADTTPAATGTGTAGTATAGPSTPGTAGATAAASARAPRWAGPPSGGRSRGRWPRDASAPPHPGAPGASEPALQDAAGGAAAPATPPAATSSEHRGTASTPRGRRRARR